MATKASALKKTLIGAGITAVVSLLTLAASTGVNQWMILTERLQDLENGFARWKVLSDHETRLQQMEVDAKVHGMLVNLLVERKLLCGDSEDDPKPHPQKKTPKKAVKKIPPAPYIRPIDPGGFKEMQQRAHRPKK